MIKGLYTQDYFLQVAEECGELIKECAKVKRVVNGRNKTPVTYNEAKENAVNEMVDVELCVEQTIIELEHTVEEFEGLIKEYETSVDVKMTWELVAYVAAKLAEDSINVASMMEEKERYIDAGTWIVSALDFVVTKRRAVRDFGLPNKVMEDYKKYKLNRWKKRQEEENDREN